jgi:single-strand DNA-binding protein
MSNLRNRVTLIGRLGKDPESTTFESGRVKVGFTLATTEVYRDKNGEKTEDTQWHNVVFWGKPAEIASAYLKKGQQVAIEGRISTRSYDDEKGVRRYVTEIVGNELVMLSSKQAEAVAEKAKA